MGERRAGRERKREGWRVVSVDGWGLGWWRKPDAETERKPDQEIEEKASAETRVLSESEAKGSLASKISV